MSQPTTAPRRSIPLGLLGMLALVALIEAGIARHDLQFSAVEADTWRAAGAAADRPTPGGVLMLGDSQVELGISPLTVEGRLGQPVRCLAIPGGQPPSSYFLLRRALRAGMRPAAVVVDFEPHLLRHGRGPGQRMWPELADLDECLDLATTLRDPTAFASMALARFVPSYRERLEIRTILASCLRGETSIMPGQMTMARRNRGMNRGALIMAKQPPGHIHDIAQWANPEPWAPHPVNAAYAHRFFRLARRHQIPVYVALMPVVPGLRQKAATTGMEAAYFAWLRKVQGRYDNVTVLDWRAAGYPDSVFVDALHLDVDGSTSVGIALADTLGRHLSGSGGVKRWVSMPPFRVDGSERTLEDHNRSAAVAHAAGVFRR